MILRIIRNTNPPPNEFPMGITTKKGKCREVLKSLYGGKGAGADWKAKFVPKLFEFGFRAATIDQTIFVLRNPEKDSEYIIIAIYVDDTVGVNKWDSMMFKFKDFLKREFDTNDEGDLEWFLSVHYNQNNEKDIMALDQRAYIEKMIGEWGFKGMKTSKTLMVEGFKIFPSYILSNLRQTIEGF